MVEITVTEPIIDTPLPPVPPLPPGESWWQRLVRRVRGWFGA